MSIYYLKFFIMEDTKNISIISYFIIILSEPKDF